VVGPTLTVAVWNVGVDVVTNQQLDDIVAMHLGGVAERCASDVIASVDIGTSRQQQPYGQQTSLLLLNMHTTTPDLFSSSADAVFRSRSLKNRLIFCRLQVRGCYLKIFRGLYFFSGRTVYIPCFKTFHSLLVCTMT